MLRVDLRSLIDRLSKTVGHEFSLNEVCERTGINRNAISKFWNHPVNRISGDQLERIVLWSFYVLRGELGEPWDSENPNKDLSDKELMDSILTTLIGIFPVGIESTIADETGAGMKALNKPTFSNEAVWNRHSASEQKLPLPPPYEVKLGKASKRSDEGDGISLELSYNVMK